MNAIALLGRRFIQRIQGIGIATLMLLQVILSIPTWQGVKLFIHQSRSGFPGGSNALSGRIVSTLELIKHQSLQFFRIYLSIFGENRFLSFYIDDFANDS